MSRKMSLEKWFVDRHVLDADNPFSGFYFKNSIHHEEWVAMWQYFYNLLQVKHAQSSNKRASILFIQFCLEFLNFPFERIQNLAHFRQFRKNGGRLEPFLVGEGRIPA